MQQPDDDLERSEIEALAATRAELGPEYDAALLSSFADRVERAIDVRVGHILMEQGRGGDLERARSSQQLTLGIISAVAAIPISIVLGLNGQRAGAADRLDRHRRGQLRARGLRPPRPGGQAGSVTSATTDG